MDTILFPPDFKEFLQLLNSHKVRSDYDCVYGMLNVSTACAYVAGAQC
jgi:hypothetical protein